VACACVSRLKREGFEEAGELVVRRAMEHQGLVAFERLWRQHFLDAMKPRFLPRGWSVDHSHDQLLCLERNVLRCVTDDSNSPDDCNKIRFLHRDAEGEVQEFSLVGGPPWDYLAAEAAAKSPDNCS